MTMKLLLIRHGETTDNLAQINAGVTNSPLTNHGVIQATRLGEYFGKSGVKFTHLFSSDLQRAFKTASIIRDVSNILLNCEGDGSSKTVPSIVQLPVLRERDFGSFEGKSFLYSPSPTETMAHFRPMETKNSMILRMDKYLTEYVSPLLAEEDASRSETVVAIVSHGIILSVLWSCLIRKFDTKAIHIPPDLDPRSSGRAVSLDGLARWTNTGYIEMDIWLSAIAGQAESPGHQTTSFFSTPKKPAWCNRVLYVRRINSREHLRGLKRTGGGLGSARHDQSQKTLDSFFKKQPSS